MIVKELKMSDIEELNDLIERVIVDLRFTSFMYDDEGAYISGQKERDLEFQKLIEHREHDVFNFKDNIELKKLSFPDALYLSCKEIEEMYLQPILSKVRGICRTNPMAKYEAVVSDEITDEYLNNLITLRWKENLKLWTIKWGNDAKKEEGNGASIKNEG